ncbi:Nucleoid-associated protein YbaB, partial [Mycobacterium numidiamassiliense]
VEFEPHPQATAVLDEFKKLNDVLENALKQKGTGSFSAKDQTETVEVVINGDMVVTELHIEDGLLRLGAETVQNRINEALITAQAQAAASIDEIAGATFEAMAGMIDSMQKIVGE